MSRTSTDSRSRFRAIVFDCLRGAWRQVLVAVLCIIGTTLVALALPWPLKLIFDHVLFQVPVPPALAAWTPWLAHGSTTSLVALAGSLILLSTLSAGFAYMQIYVTSAVGAEIIYRLRTTLFDHLQSLSLSFHNRSRSGELLSKIVVDTNTLRDTYSEYALNFATSTLTIVGMCVVMVLIQPTLGLTVILTFPILFAALFAVLKRMRLTARRQRSRESDLTTRLTEVLGAVALVQSFGRERYESERFESQSAQSKEEAVRTARLEAAVARLVEIARALGTALVMLLGGIQVLSGNMTAGDLLVFSGYIVNMYKPVRVMARLSARFSKATASVERIREILATEPEIRDDPDAVDLPKVAGKISFRDVSFGYKADELIVTSLSFDLPAGKCTALVGASGAGKSTIANMVMRLYDPSEGSVQIDGIDLRKVKRSSLRQHIGAVLQESLLFGASVRENIAYGKPNATQEEIERAAREVCAHEFIMALPGGYDHVVGESGSTLSGGQRQRLCLARALIKEPSILIMDEPTSAIDAESEARIRSAVRSAQNGKTTLVIAHHLQTVQEADHIILLSKGRIAEQGTHEELVRLGGAYCDLFQIGRGAKVAV